MIQPCKYNYQKPTAFERVGAATNHAISENFLRCDAFFSYELLGVIDISPSNSVAICIPDIQFLKCLKVYIIYHLFPAIKKTSPPKYGNSKEIFTPKAAQYLSIFVRDKLSYPLSILLIVPCVTFIRFANSICDMLMRSLCNRNSIPIFSLTESFVPGLLRCLYPGLTMPPSKSVKHTLPHLSTLIFILFALLQVVISLQLRGGGRWN